VARRLTAAATPAAAARPESFKQTNIHFETNADLSKSETSMLEPKQYLEPNRVYEFGVLATEKYGNQTVTECGVSRWRYLMASPVVNSSGSWLFRPRGHGSLSGSWLASRSRRVAAPGPNREPVREIAELKSSVQHLMQRPLRFPRPALRSGPAD